WRKHISGPPVISFHFRALQPHERITLSFQNQNIGALAMPVRLLVGSYRRAGNVCGDDIVAELQLDVSGARTFSRPVVKLELLNVGNETGVPHPLLRNSDSLATEVVLLAVVAIRKLITVVKNKIIIAVQVEHHRRIGIADETHRFSTLAVEMLMPGVKRDRKK